MKKCICFKDKEFDFQSKNGGSKLTVYKDEIYEYYYIHDSPIVVDGNIHYPILSIFFDEVFIDIIKYRRQKLKTILFQEI